MVVMGLDDDLFHVFCSRVRVGGKERAGQDFGGIVVAVILVGRILECLSSRFLFGGDCGAWMSLADGVRGAAKSVSDAHRSRGGCREPRGGFDSLAPITSSSQAVPVGYVGAG